MAGSVNLRCGVAEPRQGRLWAVSDALKRNFANYVVWKRPCRLNWLPEGLRAIEVCVIVIRLRNLR